MKERSLRIPMCYDQSETGVRNVHINSRKHSTAPLYWLDRCRFEYTHLVRGTEKGGTSGISGNVRVQVDE